MSMSTAAPAPENTDPQTVWLQRSVDQARAIITRAQTEQRDLTEDEAAEHATLIQRAENLRDQNRRTRELQESLAGNPHMARLLSANGPDEAQTRTANLQDGEPLGEIRMADYVRARRPVGADADHESLSLRKALRGIVTGNWDEAEVERRAMSEGTASAGGYLVPTVLSAELIDLARNASRVLQAGARLVPMPNRTVTVPKWISDPTAVWHTEGATIAPSDASIGAVNLVAKSLASITVLSRELLEDAPGVETELRNAFAAIFARKVDLAALYGTGVAPEPLGVKNTAGILTTSMGTNGAAPTNWDFVVDAVGALEDNNEMPSAIILAPRTARELAKLKDTQNQPMVSPGYVSSMAMLTTNQVPLTLTVGTSSDTSDMFTADWTQLYVGVRTQLQIQLLTEKYADTGQVGILAWWRGDVAVARPKAFHVTTGIR